MHQLKPNDAVKCETREEFAEVVRLLILNDIWISKLTTFNNSEIIYNSGDNIHTSISTCSPGSIAANEADYNSFQDFCAKIKGEYKKKYYYMDIKDSTGRTHRVAYNPKDLVINGKYKYRLTRIDDE